MKFYEFYWVIIILIISFLTEIFHTSRKYFYLIRHFSVQNSYSNRGMSVCHVFEIKMI